MRPNNDNIQPPGRPDFRLTREILIDDRGVPRPASDADLCSSGSGDSAVELVAIFILFLAVLFGAALASVFFGIRG